MSEHDKEDGPIQSLNPTWRCWEYDGDGTKIYKASEGYPTKTIYTDQHYIKIHFWRGRAG